MLTGALLVIAAVRLDVMVWLALHPEALSLGTTTLAAVVGKAVRSLPHFHRDNLPRQLDTARERLYRKVIEATDTLTALQSELDLAYERTVKLRDDIGGGI